MAAVVDFLDLQHPNNNVHNLRVARWLVIGGALPPPQLASLGVAHRVRRALRVIPEQYMIRCLYKIIRRPFSIADLHWRCAVARAIA